VKEATRTATKPNGTTPTTSANASPVASRAVNKSAGAGGGTVTTDGPPGPVYTSNTGSVSGNLSGIPNPATNDQIGGVVTHDYNSQPPQNQNEINVNNSNVLKTQMAPHQRSQSLSGMQPVKILNLYSTNNISLFLQCRKIMKLFINRNYKTS
jgi:hypothetical protein